ncbi:TPR repeat protein [sediment metagenome]|uniref:TPR repeat protein n=1 Tax=sediment metagenome TaxID=749907 RepID=D9PKF5_9ZZZZ
MNNVDGYFAYVNSLGQIADVSLSEQDSLTFISAEKLYMKGDCPGSIEQLKNYIQKYSNGNFILNAHFYIADCYNRNGDKENAINSYNFVINKPKNTFTEQALLSASALNYKDSSFTDALNHYKNSKRLQNLIVALLMPELAKCARMLN